jgi:hypothetical protein
MVANKHWNFLIHQVIKPVMTPSRYFYDEMLSDIPNIYQIRNNRHGSHFTALRILRKLAKSVDSAIPAYVSVAELTAYFADTFNMVDDFLRNLDLLLKHGFVEANNRVDAYSEDVDQIKITNYGNYMLSELSYNFTYLDLISTDCGLYDESVHNYVVESARAEHNHSSRHERFTRVQLRVERVGELIKYLNSEEQREKDAYSLGMPVEEMFTFKPSDGFEAEKVRVLASARKNKGVRPSGR